MFHILEEKLETDLINYVRYSNSKLSLQTGEQKFFDLLFLFKIDVLIAQLICSLSHTWLS